MHSKAKKKTGEVVAVFLSIWLGTLAMTASHWWSVYDPVTANPALLKAGSWIPGWWGIGPYAGKETVGLTVWLVGWIVLHWTIGKKEMPLKQWTTGFLAGFLLLIAALWPPVYHALLGWLPAMP